MTSASATSTHHNYPHEPGTLPGCPPCDEMLDCSHESPMVEGPDESVGIFGLAIMCGDCELVGVDLVEDRDPDSASHTIVWENGIETHYPHGVWIY